MRIERIHVDGFGRLADFDTGAESLGPLVVVLGPNEAGKSTLFSFLTTSLYGFAPASRDTNPHVPWGSSEAGGRVHLRTEDGACLVVERRLRSSPTGTLTRGETRLDLRNQPLDFVRHVPRTVFRQVFAVTLAELAGLDDDTWSRIQDRVLGSMGASDLASARDVAEQLEQEAGEIWRPTRRGNQRLRALRDEMRALRSRRSHAVARDREIRQLTEEHESVALRLDDVRRDLKRDRIVVERIQDLLPLKRQLERVAALRAQGGARAPLDDLPSDLGGTLDATDDEIGRLRGRLTAVDEDLAEPTRTAASFDAAARGVLEHRDAIEHFLASPDTISAIRARIADVRSEAEGARVESEASERQLFDEPPSDEQRARLAAISVDVLRDRVRRLDLRHRSPDVGAGPTLASAPSLPSWAPAALVIVGAGLMMWGGMSESAGVAAVGAGLLAGGLFVAMGRRTAPLAAQPAAGDAADPESEIRDALDGLPIRSDFLSPPGLPVVSALERAQEHATRLEAFDKSLEGLEARLASRRREADGLSGLLGCHAFDDPLAFESWVASALRDATRLRDAAAQAQGEHDRLLRTRETIAADVDRLEEERSALLERVAALGQGSGPGAIEAAQRRLDAHERADRIEDELDRAHPDLADRKARIAAVDAAAGSWSVSEGEIADRRVRIEEAEAQLEELVGRMRSVERDIAHLREQETVDAIDGELEALREAESRLVTERDRKWVLARLVREADRRFREEHQPDLLQRASGYLRRLTDGRYERLLVDERTDGDLFHLVGPALPRPVPLASPISTGTLEQAYLALRLAIIDHLDVDRERLPLFIDEAFVNWDAARRDQGLAVLSEVAEGRQVFAFTCHPDMADRLVARGGRLVRLQR